MGRIMSFDYGSKRTGIAISDPLQIIASPYKTCGSSNVINFVKKHYHTSKANPLIIFINYSFKFITDHRIGFFY